jgi:hypothetical protein
MALGVVFFVVDDDSASGFPLDELSLGRKT